MSTHLYDAAFTFWSQLTTERAELPGGLALANTDVPYFLSNAVWYPRTGQWRGVTEWYTARNLPPALIVASEREVGLERALEESAFTLERSFTFRRAVETAGRHVVEQVDWRQARYMGELLAQHYDQTDLALPIASSLVRAMQKSSSLQAFLSYEDNPVGAMLTFERGNSVTAMLLVDADGALEGRLTQDAARRGLAAWVLEMLPNGVTANGSLERWSIV